MARSKRSREETLSRNHMAGAGVTAAPPARIERCQSGRRKVSDGIAVEISKTRATVGDENVRYRHPRSFEATLISADVGLHESESEDFRRMLSDAEAAGARNLFVGDYASS